MAATSHLCAQPSSHVTDPPETSAETFSALVILHYAPLYRLACRLTRNDADAAEICQEAFLKAFLKFGDLSNTQCDLNQGYVRAWLLTIVRNLSFDVLRRKRRCQIVSIDESIATNDQQISE